MCWSRLPGYPRWPLIQHTIPVLSVLNRCEVVEVKGNEEIEYDGETHTAANLFDALKEGYYGRF